MLCDLTPLVITPPYHLPAGGGVTEGRLLCHYPPYSLPEGVISPFARSPRYLITPGTWYTGPRYVSQNSLVLRYLR